MNAGRRAWITLAAGDPRYLEMAVDLALSLRVWSSLPILLAADATLGAVARSRYGRVFSEVRTLEPRFLVGRARKYGVGAASGYAENVFIDADCIVLADPASIWAGAGPGPLTFAGEMLGPGDDAYHHGFSTRALMRRFGLEAYLKTNSGVFHFRREGGPEALEHCLRCYVDEIRPGLPTRLRPWRRLGDELAIGVEGGRQEFALFPQPGPMYWAPEIRRLDPKRPTKPVLHFLGPVPPATLDAVLEGVRDRRREAGLPADLSYGWWRGKARSSGWSWVAQQVHRRLVGRPA